MGDRGPDAARGILFFHWPVKGPVSFLNLLTIQNKQLIKGGGVFGIVPVSHNSGFVPESSPFPFPLLNTEK